MGILNVTPDSFSDGGLHDGTERAVLHARKMIAQGADIIDVGGESTRPGAAPVSAEEERARVVPIIEALAGEGVPISIDTYRAETARAALEAGAHVVNDVTGLRGDTDMARVIATTGAGLVAMHNSRLHDPLEDPFEDQRRIYEEIGDRADTCGIDPSQMVFDPGIGFGKDADENWTLLSRLETIVEWGMPVLLGASRKRFLGALTGREAPERDDATAATSVVGRLAGAHVFRVHDVQRTRDALLVADEVRGRST